MHFTSRTTSCVIGLTWALAGCSQSSGLPGAPSPIPVPTPSSHAAPDVTDVLPSVGSAGGGAIIEIVGTGFMPGMVAMFDGIKGTAEFDSPATSSTTFYTETPAHAVGTVDVVVTNPDGQSHRVAAGYTYAPPESVRSEWRLGWLYPPRVGHLGGVRDSRQQARQCVVLVQRSCRLDVCRPTERPRR